MRSWGWLAAVGCGVGALSLVIALGMRAAPIVLSRTTTAPSREPYPSDAPPGKAKATFASGCFWCSEAVFQQLKGVETVVSGYTGGNVANPTYEQVGWESTGHAEAIDITYDPALVTYDTLLEVFWKTHDPTTLNRQGNDKGTRYRSAIFYHDEDQRKLAESYKQKLQAVGFFSGSIVTEIVPATQFWPAEQYHQDYFNQHPDQPYCRQMIPPKLAKLRHVFGDKLKTAGE
jgi:methionine-S-sulfoxide reductase